MTQYPNDKANWAQPRDDWVYPGQDYNYASRDGAPASSAQEYDPPAGPPSQQYAYAPVPAPQGQYHAPPPAQGYYPPADPPPAYGYAVSHPEDNAPKAMHETVLAPPPGNGLYSASPDAGPSSGQEGNQSGGMSLASFFGNKGSPPMWGRQAPLGLPYSAFPPMVLLSKDHNLSGGFPELPPPSPLRPHPFATHDVTEEDWKRFLTDVKRAGSLSPTQRIKSNVIPMVTGMSFVTGFMATFAIEKKMKYKNRGAAGDLVDHWNHYFFKPRRMEVMLRQASERLSGRLSRSDEDDDDDDSSDDDRHHHHNDRRGGRRERREARRARRAERRERRARGEDKAPYELVVTSVM